MIEIQDLSEIYKLMNETPEQKSGNIADVIENIPVIGDFLQVYEVLTGESPTRSAVHQAMYQEKQPTEKLSPWMRVGLGITAALPVLTPRMVKAFHGSGVKDISKFSDEFVGTGEGVQAFGWGHYFSEDVPIAKGYEKRLSKKTFNFRGKSYIDPEFAARDIGKKFGFYEYEEDILKSFLKDSDDIEYTKKYLENRIARNKRNLSTGASVYYEGEIRADTKVLNALEEINIESTGKTYSVELLPKTTKEQENWLDWYGEVSDEQKQQIKTGLAFANVKTDTVSVESALRNQDATGRDMYYSLSQALGSEKEASKFLDRAGIHGVQYPTGSLSGKVTRQSQLKFLEEEVQDSLLNAYGENASYDEISAQARKMIKSGDFAGVPEINKPYFEKMYKTIMAQEEKYNYVVFNPENIEIKE